MTADVDAFAQWHEDEARWWNQFGGYMSYQWQMTPAMSATFRSALEDDYKSFLCSPGERLLDLGCGSGWLALYFAKQGMSVTGVDISHEQIAAANATRRSFGLESSVSFHCADFVHWNVEPLKGAFSSVFVSAFLHHLPEPELALAISKIASVVKPGGRVFLYEPLQRPGQRNFLIKVIDGLYNMGLELLLNSLPRRLNWWTERHLSEVARGYTMNSPHEAPVSLDVLQRCCSGDFEIVETKGWHLNSLGFGMQAMGLKDSVLRHFEKIARVLYRLDQFLLRHFGWQRFSVPGRFILCGVKLVRR